jgi:hypothetical protein
MGLMYSKYVMINIEIPIKISQDVNVTRCHIGNKHFRSRRPETLDLSIGFLQKNTFETSTSSFKIFLYDYDLND